jgi:thiol-disulfide isomerase/thioredoxin
MNTSINRRGTSVIVVLLILVLAAFGLYFFFKSLKESREMEREMETAPPASSAENRSVAPEIENRSVAPAAAVDPGRANPSWTLKSLDGKKVTLSEFKGHVVFLTFWATWCGYCRRELPTIQKLYETTKGDGIVFVLASSEAERPVREFMRQNKYTLPTYLFSGPPPSIFQTQGIPATFILDKNGNLARQQVGAMDWSTPDIAQYLKKLA